MGITMNEKKLKALANELAKDLKTPEDLSALTAQLAKITVEALLMQNWIITWVTPSTKVVIQAIVIMAIVPA